MGAKARGRKRRRKRRNTRGNGEKRRRGGDRSRDRERERNRKHVRQRGRGSCIQKVWRDGVVWRGQEGLDGQEMQGGRDRFREHIKLGEIPWEETSEFTDEELRRFRGLNAQKKL